MSSECDRQRSNQWRSLKGYTYFYSTSTQACPSLSLTFLHRRPVLPEHLAKCTMHIQTLCQQVSTHRKSSSRKSIPHLSSSKCDMFHPRHPPLPPGNVSTRPIQILLAPNNPSPRLKSASLCPLACMTSQTLGFHSPLSSPLLQT